MGISNLQATKYFDEVRGYFARQTKPGVRVEIEVRWGRGRNESLYIALFDENNPQSVPLVLMLNETGSGWNWINQIGSGVVFDVVNEALLAFNGKKSEWSAVNHRFTWEEAVGFLVEFIRQVPTFLL